MTRFHKEPIKCPYCTLEEDVTIWDRVSADEDPDIKERLLTNRLQVKECTNCGRKYQLFPPLLYTDESQKIVLFYSPELAKLFQDKAFKDLRIIPDEIMQDLPSIPSGKGWKLRLCTDYNSLIEKIHIFDSRLDDRIVEVVKLAVASRMATDENKITDDIRFLASTPDEIMLLAMYEDKGDNNSSEDGNVKDGEDEYNSNHLSDGTLREEVRLSMELYDNAEKLISSRLGSDDKWSLIDRQYAISLVNLQ